MKQDIERHQIERKIRKIAILETPGVILVGLGLHGKFVGSQGNAFHPLLNDQDTVNSMLITGGAIMAFCAYKIVSLLIAKKQIDKD